MNHHAHRTSVALFAKRTCVALAVLAASATPAFALINGTATTSFAAVGQLGGATGVLVASNWVLTAAHVVDGVAAGSSTFASGLGTATVDAVYKFSTAAHPNNDIALVHLATSLSGPLPVVNDAFISSAKAATLTQLTIATAQNQSPRGYGVTAGQGTQLTYMNGASIATVNWITTKGGATVQGGDSGGALFMGAVSDSAGATLLGLASAQLTNSDGSLSSAFVQTQTYKDWIDATMASSGQKVQWLSTAAVPEPSTWALTVLGGLAAARLARRRTAGHQAN